MPSSRVPPNPVHPPQAKGNLLRPETAQLAQITSAINQIAQKTFHAVGQARELKNQRHLNSDTYSKASQVKHLLKYQYAYVNNVAYELKCSNRFYQKKLDRLEALQSKATAAGLAPLDEDELNHLGYGPSYLRTQVATREKWLSDMISQGLPEIREAVELYNQINPYPDLAPMPEVIKVWQSVVPESATRRLTELG